MKSKSTKSVKQNALTAVIKSKPFPIVGIGASAGGMEALELFFTHLAENSGMAFVVIQHLDPTHAGIMPELLQRITPLQVFEASDRQKVKPNCIYVIPPNKSISILRGVLHLFDPTEARGLRLPIDIFFRSLAADKESASVGVVLSGMGSDGSLGLKAIKEKNGTVLVQDPRTAKFDGMPRSAVEAVTADFVAPVEELPVRLVALLQHTSMMSSKLVVDGKNNSQLEKIIILLREQSGHDFSLYKKTTLLRRIERRKLVHQIDKTQNYIRFLQENPAEVEILFKELLIGVTSFFRDALVWETLRDNIIPALIENLPIGHVLRAWIAGCSTGEEAYSLAIVFKEVMEKAASHRNLTLQIFATDLDHDAIDIARKGFFPANIVADVSPERLARFFTLKNGGYLVNTEIREMIVFAPQNVTKDPPFTKLDMLTCRNLLIYMESELQKRLMNLFNYSLNPGGILVLGSAETPGSQRDGFEVLDAKLKIYSRSAKAKISEIFDFPTHTNVSKMMAPEKKKMPEVIDNIQAVADNILLQRFSPASVLVNEKGDIIYITGRTGKYLEPLAGKANWNIHAMAREGLRHELPGIFRKAILTYDPVILRNLKVGTNGGTQFIDLTVQRLESPALLKGMLMVVFTDVPAVAEPVMLKAETGKQRHSARETELEAELSRTYEELQSTREEMQTSQEELQSTNEELQSSNEELQSTNEEITTSKEEMQSLNEELQTVNVELQSKLDDFVQANNDIKNLLNTTGIATLFLDKELNIRRYTDSLSKIFKLRSVDVGRPFTDLVSNLQYPEMNEHAQLVIKNLTPIEKVVTTIDGQWFNARIMPYRTLDDRIDGLVITFVDITDARRLEKALAVSEIRYRSVFESAKDGIIILDADTGKIVDVNPFLVELLGYNQAQFMEKEIWEIGLFKDIVANQEKFMELKQKGWVRYDDLPLETAEGKNIKVEFISNLYQVGLEKVIQCIIRQTVSVSP